MWEKAIGNFQDQLNKQDDELTRKFEKSAESMIPAPELDNSLPKMDMPQPRLSRSQSPKPEVSAAVVDLTDKSKEDKPKMSFGTGNSSVVKPADPKPIFGRSSDMDMNSKSPVRETTQVEKPPKQGGLFDEVSNS